MRRYNLRILYLIIMLSLPSPARAETLSGKVRRGNALFHETKYQESLKKYQEAQVESPADERLMFNLGNAQYKLNDFENALSEYSQCAQAEDKQMRAQSHYNAGNTLYRMGKLEEAVDQYLKALQFSPDDEDAKYNLEFVRQEIRRRMNEQQQRQQDQQKQKDQNQQDQENRQSRQDQQKNQENQKEESEAPQDKQGKSSGQQQQKPDKAKQQQQQPGRRDGEAQAEESTGGPNDKATRTLPPDKMTQENIDRYLQAVEAESAENMKNFLRRQQPVEASAVPRDW